MLNPHDFIRVWIKDAHYGSPEIFIIITSLPLPPKATKHKREFEKLFIAELWKAVSPRLKKIPKTAYVECQSYWESSLKSSKIYVEFSDSNSVWVIFHIDKLPVCITNWWDISRVLREIKHAFYDVDEIYGRVVSTFPDDNPPKISSPSEEKVTFWRKLRKFLKGGE